jgi:hypothetical protein
MKSVTQEWLKNTQPEVRRYKSGMTLQDNRPRMRLADGITLSVQASSAHYCSPRHDGAAGFYDDVEVGFPSEHIEELEEYIEIPGDQTQSVFPHVPITVIDQIIAKHGGIS